ncbi:MAG: 50S ribosomal protein L20 [Candidatus Gracilibacteria bacterium]|jgi:large subunit ribosomal protein L20|nr:MAG: 50S ribosomal protein L20, large subunit ribosomal protein L20 [Candidatus Peregrinibacteria bacterium GW2011_GWF2_38_29]KKQ72129.1 MAG: 50S ribosomal protein L20 [Candidatus Peregrinibacteria bacterium GW2011_GWA2_38_36]KKR07106.1 MAG: 50S ribosomal protein L20, large subunit ribosomal protein L20 [Candidatus Peregrinibacteria bacterium GW2011_GWC2_39_14]HBB03236.1 50S ribosomal protein L20 [Candidatus Peregrinibacteria bacterium]
MTRVKGGVHTKKRHNSILKAAKGFRSGRSRKYGLAKMALMKQGQNSYIGRRQKKRQMRTTWIVRMQAECKKNGINYSRFINGLVKKAILLDRKVLADIALSEPGTFKKVVEEVLKA